MYNINLIHEKIVPIRKQRKRLSLVSLYILIWAVSAVVVVFFVITNNTRIRDYTKAAQILEDRNALPSGLMRSDVDALSRQLQASATVLKTLQQQTMRWGPKLRLLNRHLPKDAWLNRLSCRPTTSQPGQPPPSNPQGGAPSGPPPSKGELVVEGMLLIPEGGMGTEPLEQYLATLRADKAFMVGLSSINLQIVGRKLFGPREVASFVLVCAIAEGVQFDA